MFNLHKMIFSRKKFSYSKFTSWNSFQIKIRTEEIGNLKNNLKNFSDFKINLETTSTRLQKIKIYNRLDHFSFFIDNFRLEKEKIKI